MKTKTKARDAIAGSPAISAGKQLCLLNETLPQGRDSAQLLLTRATSSSWRAGNLATVEHVAALLRARGFFDLEAKQYERYRLRHRIGALAVLYQSGAIVAQGPDRQRIRLTRFLNLVAWGLDVAARRAGGAS